MVESLLIEDGKVSGIIDQLGVFYESAAVVVATGTFLHGLIHIGKSRIPSGRAGEFPSIALADQLQGLGFAFGRMKTGTPARILRRSIDFSPFREQHGDPEPGLFHCSRKIFRSRRSPATSGALPSGPMISIRRHIHLSPLYNGAIRGVSARYCPSLEDKVMKFPQRIFIRSFWSLRAWIPKRCMPAARAIRFLWKFSSI